MALEQGLGHEDLDKLMRQAQPLDFTFGNENELIIIGIILSLSLCCCV
jgi:hypothetical protein